MDAAIGSYALTSGVERSLVSRSFSALTQLGLPYKQGNSANGTVSNRRRGAIAIERFIGDLFVLAGKLWTVVTGNGVSGTAPSRGPFEIV